MTTNKRLIEAAAAGGEEAVTLRAAGMSRNAPYKHFANRSALLAAVDGLVRRSRQGDAEPDLITRG